MVCSDVLSSSSLSQGASPCFSPFLLRSLADFVRFLPSGEVLSPLLPADGGAGTSRCFFFFLPCFSALVIVSKVGRRAAHFASPSDMCVVCTRTSARKRYSLRRVTVLKKEQLARRNFVKSAFVQVAVYQNCFFCFKEVAVGRKQAQWDKLLTWKTRT